MVEICRLLGGPHHPQTGNNLSAEAEIVKLFPTALENNAVPSPRINKTCFFGG